MKESALKESPVCLAAGRGGIGNNLIANAGNPTVSHKFVDVQFLIRSANKQ
jgi:hypothetical protein